MLLSDLKYDYPDELIATSPQRPSRVMWVDSNGNPSEITIDELIQKIPAGDILVLNDTKVLKRRVFIKSPFEQNEELEILFLDHLPDGLQKVLFPSKKFKVGDKLTLPNGSVMTLIEKGLPQTVKIEPALTESDFDQMAELPLPPYIQKARHERHNQQADESWYQTAWAKNPGSFAAPTASLHFTESDITKLKQKGVNVLTVTLHVGLGTFLPVKVENLDEHKMHEEIYSVSELVWNEIQTARKNQSKIWALGTTVTRTLETVARTAEKGDLRLQGASDLLLQVGSEFKIVDRLMTNFHQPESTLLALVSAFSSLDNVKHNYEWAIERRFKLFSYGDLSVWLR
ncbi:MAG: tRNA preQ1(34) S-adenosylmethionine ribosyltransferase-isomerase QueA [Pseudobdellovibrio sp.]